MRVLEDRMKSNASKNDQKSLILIYAWINLRDY